MAAAGSEEAARALAWVIAGSESGGKARPAELDWFRSLRDQCERLGIPYFFKQWKDPGKEVVSLPLLDGREHAAFPEPCALMTMEASA